MSGGGTRGPYSLRSVLSASKGQAGPQLLEYRLAEARVTAKEVAEIFFGMSNFGSEGSFGRIRVRTVVSAGF